MKQKDLFQTPSFFQGMRDGVPPCIYFVFVFIAIGGAYQASGLDSVIAIFSTILIYSGPAQLVTVDLLSDGAWATLLITTVILNVRFMFMSASLLPLFKEQKKLTLALAFQVVSTTSFALTFTHCKQHPTTHPFSYFLGVVSVGYPTAIIATYAGTQFAQSIPQNYIIILQMLLPIYFTYTLINAWPQKKPILAGVLGFILAPSIEHFLPNGGLLGAALISGFIVFFLDRQTKVIKMP